MILHGEKFIHFYLSKKDEPLIFSLKELVKYIKLGWDIRMVNGPPYHVSDPGPYDSFTVILTKKEKVKRKRK